MRIKKYDILIVRGIRPGIVVQNNRFNQSSSTTVVCPLSSVLKKIYPHHMVVKPSFQNGLKKTSRADLLQIRTIDQERIIKKIGVLDERYRDELKAKFFISFDLDDIL